jgi:hypothetical protein
MQLSNNSNKCLKQDCIQIIRELFMSINNLFNINIKIFFSQKFSIKWFEYQNQNIIEYNIEMNTRFEANIDHKNANDLRFLCGLLEELISAPISHSIFVYYLFN